MICKILTRFWNFREVLFNIINGNYPEVENFIITHGTDTMIETSLFLSHKLIKVENRMKIVLTGAFLPESFKDSDADFNIGVAIGGAFFRLFLHFIPYSLFRWNIFS